jgi:hypothetical protein
MLFVCFVSALNGVKTVYPCTLQVRLISKLGKTESIDNYFFSENDSINRLTGNSLCKTPNYPPRKSSFKSSLKPS